MNPFDPALDPDHLYNISSGKSADEATTNFLLNFRTIGKASHDNFIAECNENPARFEEKISNVKVLTFATKTKRQKISDKDNKIQAFAQMRDVFGCVLHLALEKKVDMAIVFKSPLTKFPLALSHCDGSIQKTVKSKLRETLEYSIQSTDPMSISVTIIDAFFFLHLSVDLPKNFGGVADYLLRSICYSKGSVIHFVSDRTVSPSIKDIERDCRSSELRETAFAITGPLQNRPSDWLKALRCDAFKNALIQFLVNHWLESNPAHILKDKTLYANCGNMCYSFKVADDKVIRRIEPLLFSNHEEADSRMLYHLTSSDTQGEVVIRTNDTDVLVALLGSYHDVRGGLNIWLEMGLHFNNTLRYINVTQLQAHLGEILCKSLPGFHALTGSDYSPSFSRKGKQAPFKKLMKNINAQRALGNLGRSEEISEQDITAIEKFVCEMYGHKNIASVDEVRLDVFLRTYKAKKNQTFSFAKKNAGKHISTLPSSFSSTNLSCQLYCC